MIELLRAAQELSVELYDPEFIWPGPDLSTDRIRFDLTELNDRTIGGLRTLLREDQIARLGGLPVPLDRMPFR